MVKLSFGNRRYVYFHANDGSEEAIEVHHVISESSRSRSLFFSSLFILLLANAFYVFFGKTRVLFLTGSATIQDSWIVVPWILVLSGFFSISLTRKSVKKESIIIMPAFGVQLETHYASGRKVSQFIPIDKILKPVLSECVTPMTCYWCLSLILRGEEELTLVFKELSPPVKILVPIWKALRAATDTKECESVVEEE